MTKIDLYEKDNQVKSTEITIGFSAEASIVSFRRKDQVTGDQVESFRKSLIFSFCSGENN